MGERPEGKTLERIDNEGNYEPENCRWATGLEQQQNTRRSARITFNGTTRSLSAWSRAVGLSITCLSKRLFMMNWTPEKALTEPPMSMRDRGIRSGEARRGRSKPNLFEPKVEQMELK